MIKMTEKEKTYSDFINALYDKSIKPKKVSSYYRSKTDPMLTTDPGTLETILCIEESHLSDTARESLAILENEDNYRPSWVDLKRKMSAYLTVQDVFPGLILKSRDNLTLFRQWYFITRQNIF